MSASVVVFDGECALCNGFVAWLIRHDSGARFLIAGSAGEVGKRVVVDAGLDGAVTESTIVVWDGRRARTRSDAVLAIAAQLPWPWRAASWGRIVPRPLRDRIYDAIAARRPAMEADDPACGVPPAALVAQWRSRLATLENVASLAPAHD